MEQLSVLERGIIFLFVRFSYLFYSQPSVELENFGNAHVLLAFEKDEFGGGFLKKTTKLPCLRSRMSSGRRDGGTGYRVGRHKRQGRRLFSAMYALHVSAMILA